MGNCISQEGKQKTLTELVKEANCSQEFEHKSMNELTCSVDGSSVEFNYGELVYDEEVSPVFGRVNEGNEEDFPIASRDV